MPYISTGTHNKRYERIFLLAGLVEFLRNRDRKLRLAAAIGLATVWAQSQAITVRFWVPDFPSRISASVAWRKEPSFVCTTAISG